MKIKKSDEQLITDFWTAHEDALFSPRTVALVLDLCVNSLDKYRAAEKGPKYIKMLYKIYYRKRDVLEYMKGFEK
jgi:hypothetical protein